MKTIGLAVFVSFLALSGLAAASQSGEEKDSSSMMQEMMKDRKQGEKAGMMRMMKMMDQCAAMMDSADGENSRTEQSRK